jgi:hypothetical protein
MKSITIILLLLTGILSAFAAQTPSLADRIAGADVIAIVSVTNVTKTVSTNADGSQVVAFIADASVERTLKGEARKSVRVKDETTGTVFSADDLYRPPDAPLKSDWRMVGTRRFIVLLKASGDLYTPLGADSVAGVHGERPATARVAWVWGCPTLDEAVATIETFLNK